MLNYLFDKLGMSKGKGGKAKGGKGKGKGGKCTNLITISSFLKISEHS
jgi:hypothetical protein